MENFVEKNLVAGEKVIYKAVVHPMVYGAPVVYFFMALAIFLFGKFALHMHSLILPVAATAMLLVAAYQFLLAYFHRNYTEIAITNKRLVVKRGVVSRETVELPLFRIESVIVEQSFSERLIDAGSVGVHGIGSLMAPIRFIDHPMQFRNNLNQAIAEAKQFGIVQIN